MVTPEDIKRLIEAYFSESKVTVSGDGRHFEAIIVSDEFSGKSRIQQHQMVYEALGDRMKEEIHALSMRTMTLEDSAKESTVQK